MTAPDQHHTHHPEETPVPDTSDRAWIQSLGFDEQPVEKGGKRLGVQWTPWMGDWFTSWSPRNGNSNAEGQWDQWVDLALKILRDPLTEIVRPDAYQAGPEPIGFYDGAVRDLTDAELRGRFDGKASA